MSAVRRYRAHGLRIAAELDLPELHPGEAGPVDLRVALEPGTAVDAVRDFQPVAGGGQEMRVPGAGVYHVEDGALIRVRPEPWADPGRLRLFLVGSALGMALHQRGVLALHAAGVARPGGATAFVGESGAGKSTLAAALGQRGHAVLGDDVLALDLGGQTPRALPGSGAFKVGRETLARLAIPSAGLEPVAGRCDKLYLPNPAPALAPVALREIVVVSHEHAEETALAPLVGIERLAALARQTYRPGYVALLGREVEHFRQIAGLAGAVEVLALRRPRSYGALRDTIRMLEARWAGGA
mgnify:CR=1 FL=1